MNEDRDDKYIPREKLLEKVRKHEEQNKLIREALRFYANENNWMITRKDELHTAKRMIVGDVDSFGHIEESGLASTLIIIGGKLARESLKKVGVNE